jgi:Pentose-5-phosphate-3-epimerase
MFIDYLLVMTVSPGFAGQSYLDFVTDKIKDMVKYSQDYSFKIVVDGAYFSGKKYSELGKIGVEGFVLGTSALFNKNKPYKEIISSLKNI